MRSRLRSTAPDLPIFMRATTNPGGRGHHWVKKMFIDPAPYGKALMLQTVKQEKYYGIQQDIAKLEKPYLNGGLFQHDFLITRTCLKQVTTKRCCCRSQSNNGDSYLKAIGILKKVLRSQSLTAIFMLLNLLIFLAIGLSLEHVITVMVLTVVWYGLLSHHLSNSSCTRTVRVKSPCY